MADRVVTTSVDVGARTATLGGDAGPPTAKSFGVREGDTVSWEVRDVPAGSTARVKFVSFPGKVERALFANGNVLESVGGWIAGGAVRADAFAGEYSYVVELVNTQTTEITRLDCLSSSGQPTIMGGAVKDGGPKPP